MDLLLDQIVNSISLGSIYALIAIGYTMIYGIVRLINFAHGDILMLGAFFGYFILNEYGVSPLFILIAFVVSMGGSAILGFIIERTCYKPLRTAPRLNSLITAIGVSLFLENGARVFPPIGPNPKEFPVLTNKMVEIFGYEVNATKLIVLFVSIAIMIGLTILVNKTKVGKAMRAVALDKPATSLMGISVNGIISFTFCLGAALAAAAGMLYAASYPQVEPYMGIMPGLKAFVAAVLGGIGSIPGAMIGGYIIGIAETLTKGYLSSKLADGIVFGILILILLIKPTGIMGSKIKEKV